MPNILTRDTQPTAMIPGIYSVIKNRYNKAPKMINQITKPINSKTKWVDLADFPVLGTIGEKQELGPLNQLSIPTELSKRFETKTYGAFIQKSREFVDDNQYGQATDYGQGDLADAAAETIERLGWDLINNGFATTKTSDGAYLFSATHVHYTSGPTYSNLASSAAAPSVTTIWALIDLARSQKDSGGNIAYYGNSLDIWIPPKLERVTREAVQTAKDPDSNWNTDNILKSDFTIRIHVVPWMTSETAWIATWGQPELYRWHRVSPEFKTEGDFLTMDSKISVYFRVGYGARNPKNIFGNAGV